MPRVPNWSNALVLWAREEIGKPYLWGETDCGSLLRRGVAVMYGEAIGGIPSYNSLATAYRAADAIGGVHGALMRLGADMVGLKFAAAGDIILADDYPADDHLLNTGILCLGPNCLTSELASGVVAIPRPREGPFEAWRLPYELPNG